MAWVRVVASCSARACARVLPLPLHAFGLQLSRLLVVLLLLPFLAACEAGGPVTVRVSVDYAQQLTLGVSPAADDGTTEWTIVNTDIQDGAAVRELVFPAGTQITFSVVHKNNAQALRFVADAPGGEVSGNPLTVPASDGLLVRVVWGDIELSGLPIASAGPDQRIALPLDRVTLDGSDSLDADGGIETYAWKQLSGPSDASLATADEALTEASGLELGSYVFELTVSDADGNVDSDEVQVDVLEGGDFRLGEPSYLALVTDTRKPHFTWDAVEGATGYDIWLNVTRDDYDWTEPGNLLDRYTKVGTATTNEFTLAQELSDRWTYRWYVTASGVGQTSDIGQFGLYVPTLEQQDDGVALVAGARDLNKNGSIEPYEDWKRPIDERLEDLMGRMSDAQKFAQLFYGATDVNPNAGWAFSYGVDHIDRNAQKAAAAFQLGIPVAFAGDKIHGWKTIFPTQLGLAATRNLQLAYRAGDLQRREHKAAGFTGTLSPLAEVDTMVRYPRFQEGCGEDADFCAAMVRAMVAGMQGGPEPNPHSLLVTIKHWPGQGAGGESLVTYDAVTQKYHMRPWLAAMEANGATVMPGYAGSSLLDPGGPGAGSSKKILDYLRNELGFDGLIVTDWLPAATNVSVTSISAGADVMGGAPAEPTDMNQLLEGVGRARFEKAVRRVLELKFRLGMFENPYDDPLYSREIWHGAEAQEIVLEGARQSLTLLKNDGVLPLDVDTLSVAGPRANHAGGTDDCNVIWQSVYHDNPQARSYLAALTARGAEAGVAVSSGTGAADAAVVVIGENSYTHATEWPEAQVTIPSEQLAVINGFVNQGVPVVVVVISPRPYVLTEVVQKAAAVVLAYRPGNGGGTAVAELLFGDVTPKGKLPFQLPRSEAQVGPNNRDAQVERWDLPFDLGASDAEREQLRALIDANETITDPTAYGDPLFHFGAGLQSFTPGNAQN